MMQRLPSFPPLIFGAKIFVLPPHCRHLSRRHLRVRDSGLVCKLRLRDNLATMTLSAFAESVSEEIRLKFGEDLESESA